MILARGLKLFNVFALGVFILGWVEIVNAADDWQYWNELILKHKVANKLDVHVKLEQRFVDDFSDFGLHNYTSGFVYNFNRYFDGELNYKFEREKGKTEWTDEHRIEMIGVLKWQWSEINFKLRNRLEYRNIEGDENWRLREKIKLKKTVSVHGFYFKPYVSEEIFYDFKIGDINQNRFSVGVSKEIGRDLEMSVYYVSKNNKKKGKWSNINVLGTEFVINF